MNHLNAADLVDAVDGELSSAANEHLRSCSVCQTEAARLAELLQRARQVEVPEPSPLFWPHFSERVRAAIDADARPETRWRTWRWLVVAPIGALALFAVATVGRVPPQSLSPAAVQQVQGLPLLPGPVEPDVAAWTLLGDLVGDFDWDTASAAGVALEPDQADQAASALSAEEQQELARLLKAELQRSRS